MTRLLILLLFPIILFGQSLNQPVDVPIQNHSFEEHGAAPTETIALDAYVCGNAWESNRFIPGWQVPYADPVFKIFEPSLFGPALQWPCYNTASPDGSVVALVQGDGVYQDLGVTIASFQVPGSEIDGDGVLVMKFWVKNFLNTYPGWFEAEILIGTVDTANIRTPLDHTHELCETDGWGTRNWKEITLVCPSPDYLVHAKWPPPAANPAVEASPSDHIIIKFYSSGWTLLFDDVSMTFTPTQ